MPGRVVHCIWMIIMRFYKTLQEKGQYFIKRNLKVDDLHQLLELMNEFMDSGGVLFRGQPEARFMLYSSLQRLWIDRKLEMHYENYRELIDNLVDNSRKWNSGLISRYLKNAGWKETELSVLSIMQHYGVPTPLLDFTYDIQKSLFFATQHVDMAPPGSEIERYFSIYFVYRNNPVLVSVNNDKMSRQSHLDAMMESGLTIIDTSDEAYRIQNNLNILNQEGAFIFNSSATDPLEKHYFKHVSRLRRLNQDADLPQEIGGCINISKRLAKPIRDYLEENGIDRHSMFPDLNQMSIDCLNMEWKKIEAE